MTNKARLKPNVNMIKDHDACSSEQCSFQQCRHTAYQRHAYRFLAIRTTRQQPTITAYPPSNAQRHIMAITLTTSKTARPSSLHAYTAGMCKDINAHLLKRKNTRKNKRGSVCRSERLHHLMAEHKELDAAEPQSESFGDGNEPVQEREVCDGKKKFRRAEHLAEVHIMEVNFEERMARGYDPRRWKCSCCR
jgi:hypothetical protein